MTIKTDIQALELDALVEMFVLDTTNLGGVVYRFVNGNILGSSVLWQGNTYTPIDIEAEGFEVTSKGTLPTPTIRISNVTQLMSSVVIANGDLVGATFYRYRTLKKYLDGQPSADPSAQFPPDKYVVDHKSQHNKLMIEWRLAAAMDQQGKLLPGRQILRDVCTHRYRVWDATAGAFDYTKATCPYTGSLYFDEQGVATTNALDACGKRLSDCKLRFGNAPLPTRAFPGVRLF